MLCLCDYYSFFFFCISSYISRVLDFGWGYRFCVCDCDCFWSNHRGCIPSSWVVHAECVFAAGEPNKFLTELFLPIDNYNYLFMFKRCTYQLTKCQTCCSSDFSEKPKGIILHTVHHCTCLFRLTSQGASVMPLFNSTEDFRVVSRRLKTPVDIEKKAEGVLETLLTELDQRDDIEVVRHDMNLCGYWCRSPIYHGAGTGTVVVFTSAPHAWLWLLKLDRHAHEWEIAVILRNFRKTKLSQNQKFLFFFFF